VIDITANAVVKTIPVGGVAADVAAAPVAVGDVPDGATVTG
jgi:hypothetical protein